MSAKATRSQKILDKMGARLGMSDEGKQWLIAALDIFHDNPLNCTGYPDGSSSPCVTRLQKYTATLGANPGNTTSNWDCLILDTPHPQLVKLYASQLLGVGSTSQPCNSISNATGATSFSFGGLMCITAPAGSNFDAASVITGLGAGTYAVFPLVIDPSLTAGDFRVIAKGFEVHNVTNQLSRGGTVTVFESPLNSFTTAQTFLLDTGTVLTDVSAVVNPQWPANSSSAYALANSKQWEAEKGAYVMGRQMETELPVENGLNFTAPFYYNGESTAAPIAGIAPQVLSDINAHGAIPACLWENFNFTGAFFTGLANASALTVNYMVYLENHPSYSDTAIYSLAKPPPCRDDIALSMYTCIINEMPVGVPVSENGLGDWFADAISTVADYVSPVLSAIPHPATQAIGMGLRAAGNAGKMYQTNANAFGNTPVGNKGNLATSKAETKLRNAEIRARNEEIRLRKAAKAAGKG